MIYYGKCALFSALFCAVLSALICAVLCAVFCAQNCALLCAVIDIPLLYKRNLSQGNSVRTKTSTEQMPTDIQE